MSILLILDSSSLSVSDTGDFNVQYQPPIKLSDSLDQEQWELALIKANLWYSWYNISASKGNNTFRYNNGVSWSGTITIPDGQYTIGQINSYLHDVMKANGDYTVVSGVDTFDIEIEPNYSTLRVKLTFTNSYQLDLSLSDLYLLLGGESTTYSTDGDLPNVANINDGINNLAIHCNIISGLRTYENAKRSDVIYTFVPDSVPGTNIDVNPVNKIYLPINVRNNQIENVNMRITDNSGNPIDFNGEPVSYLLHARRASNIE